MLQILPEILISTHDRHGNVSYPLSTILISDIGARFEKWGMLSRIEMCHFGEVFFIFQIVLNFFFW